jgi:hypothetical protein
MRAPSPRAIAVTLGVCAIAQAGATAPASLAGRHPDKPPSRLLVTAREYSFTLSQPKLAAGPSIVQLYNYGEDPHDLQLQRIGSDHVYSFGETAPGEQASLDLRLRRASRYRLWCSLEGHAELGMVAKLKTAKRKHPELDRFPARS